MIRLPVNDPGKPDTRSATRLLVWVGRHQVGTLVLGIVFGVVWMVAQALMPFAIGRAIEEGIVDDDSRALVLWSGILLGLGAVQAAAGVMRHRAAVSNWLQASFRFAQLVGHHAARSGPAVRAQHSTGEVVATVSNDAMRAGGAFDITARLAGAVVAYVVVAVILLSASVVLGLLVLIGVPILVVTLGAVIRPLQARQREQRAQVGQLTALGADTAAGLRVLRGIGGERAFHRPLPGAVPAGAARGRARGRPTVDARRGAGAAARRLRGLRHLAERAFRALGPDRHRRPRRLLRLRRLPRHPAADRGRGGGQDHALARGRAADGGRPRRRAPRARACDACRGAARRRAAGRPALGARRRAGPPHVRRLGRSGRVRCDRRPPGPLRRRGRRHARRRPARAAAGRGRAAADRRQRARSAPLLGHAAERARPVGDGERRRDPRRDLGRERGGRARRRAGRARDRDGRAWPLVLGRPASAPRARPRSAVGGGGPRPRRADERRRRAHRGPDRAPAARAARGAHDRGRVDEPARARPGRSRRARARWPRRRCRHAPRAARLARGLPRDRHEGRGRCERRRP